MAIERIFTSDILRVGYLRGNDKPNDCFVIVASKDRSEKRNGVWIINHLSMEEACTLKNSLVTLLEKGEKDA